MLNSNSNQKIIEKLQSVDWDFTESNSSNSIHSIHPYPAKFIPEIPQRLIKLLGMNKEAIVCDPFCGSGTTLRAAQDLGISSIGIDLNPIACMISRVKTSTAPESLVEHAFSITQKAEKNKSDINEPDIPNIKHWFKSEIIEQLMPLIAEIQNIDDPLLRLHLKFCISTNLVRLSNQDSDTRYAAIEKNIKAEDVNKSFLKTAEKLAKIKKQTPVTEVDVSVVEKDIQKVSAKDIPQDIGLLLTSPPYPNAYEYWLYHKYRMFWLGYDPLAVKRDEIGARPHYFKKNPQTEIDFQTQMRDLIKNLKPKFVDGSFLAFVIGNSRIHGKDIDNTNLIIEAAQSLDIPHFTTIIRSINQKKKSFNPVNSRLKNESIVIFRCQ